MDEQNIEAITGAKVTVTTIELEMEKDIDKIRRIKFHTDKGTITVKPKIERSAFEDGLKVTKTDQMKVEDLPQCIKEWAKIISKTEKIQLEINYKVMTVNRDGEEVTYRFVNSVNEIEKWKQKGN